jgi:hypothetical protein
MVHHIFPTSTVSLRGAAGHAERTATLACIAEYLRRVDTQVARHSERLSRAPNCTGGLNAWLRAASPQSPLSR